MDLVAVPSLVVGNQWRLNTIEGGRSSGGPQGHIGGRSFEEFVKAFLVSGALLVGRRRQPFRKAFAAESPDAAREILYCEFGSKHRSKRREIEIVKVEEIPADQVSDPVVAYRLAKGK